MNRYEVWFIGSSGGERKTVNAERCIVVDAPLGIVNFYNGDEVVAIFFYVTSVRKLEPHCNPQPGMETKTFIKCQGKAFGENVTIGEVS